MAAGGGSGDSLIECPRGQDVHGVHRWYSTAPMRDRVRSPWRLVASSQQSSAVCCTAGRVHLTSDHAWLPPTMGLASVQLHSMQGPHGVGDALERCKAVITSNYSIGCDWYSCSTVSVLSALASTCRVPDPSRPTPLCTERKVKRQTITRQMRMRSSCRLRLLRLRTFFLRNSIPTVSVHNFGFVTMEPHAAQEEFAALHRPPQEHSSPC